MRIVLAWAICLALGGGAAADDPIFEVRDLDGAAGRVGAPVFVDIDVRDLFGQEKPPPGLALFEIGGPGGASPPPRIPVQFERHVPGVRPARLWWLMPEGPAGERRFRLSSGVGGPAARVATVYDYERRRVDLTEGDLRVLRYNHGAVPVPEGTPPHFAASESYERGDYIHPLYGPYGEELTEDYPRDHPHHRGVWWSWPVTRYRDQVADIWAVVGVWSRPVQTCDTSVGPVFATIQAQNRWEFGKGRLPIAYEQVWIRAFERTGRSRFVDIELRLQAEAPDVAIGGRPKAGYGGFSLRAAPCQDRQITLHLDPETASPRRAWIDYSGRFAGGRGLAGVAIFEHVDNPNYPNPLHEYPQCNCVMPAYPAEREVVLPQMRDVATSKDKPLVLKHRLWIHAGGPDEARLGDVWAAYANPPRVTIVRE